LSGPTSWFERIAEHREWLARANALLFAAWLLLSLLAFRHLPERIPVHFVPGGAPTRWEETTLWRWLLLPLVAAGLAVFFPLMERLHEAINRPYRPASEEPQVRARRERLGRTYRDLCTTLLILIFGAVHLGTWLVATGAARAIPTPLLLVAFGAAAAILLLIVPLHRAGQRRPDLPTSRI
jgi:uncharacterized membrane protein